MTNIEIKFRVDGLENIREFLNHLPEVSFRWQKQQKDVYFRVPEGRLKLRVEDGQEGVLIYYQRPDQPKARESHYLRSPVAAPASVEKLLASALGKIATVQKTRELWLFRNVRIHLDRVEDLGEFLEFESVVDVHTDATTARKNLESIQHILTERFLMIPESRGYLNLIQGTNQHKYAEQPITTNAKEER